MKVVKEAKMEIVKARDLKIGDEILWSDLRCRVEKIDCTLEHCESLIDM